MNKERYTQALILVLIAAVLFTAGFYVGKGNSSLKNAPMGLLNATSTESVDLGAFWKAWNLLDQKFSPGSSTTPLISNQNKIWGAIQGLANSYGDPYTVFFPPVESKSFEEEITGSFGGVGMEIGIQDGVLTVVAPLKGTPAEAAGIKAGDKIISIGDKSTLNISTDDAIGLIRGEVGTSVVVTFGRVGVKESITKTLVRANIEIPTVDTKILPGGVFVIRGEVGTSVVVTFGRVGVKESITKTLVRANIEIPTVDTKILPGGVFVISLY